jgi:hypothetical protein
MSGSRGRAMDRALGSVGLLLMILVAWAANRGRPGQPVIWLVTAIGWVVDRLPPKQHSARHPWDLQSPVGNRQPGIPAGRERA